MTFSECALSCITMGQGIRLSLLLMLLAGCVGTWHAPGDFNYVPVTAGDYQIATYQRLTDSVAPVRIYLEGDGNSFNSRGTPTADPTPRSTFVRDLAAYDPSSNVVYMARPCQYIMSTACRQTDWTDGRFSQKIIDSMSTAIKQIAGSRPVILIGYSGGAMISGLVIEKNPDLDVLRWITVAGVLNHSDWTEYFDDAPLSHSLNMNTLPRVSQTHYVARGDKVVPNQLSRKWTGDKNLVYIDNATHNKFPVADFSFGILTN